MGRSRHKGSSVRHNKVRSAVSSNRHSIFLDASTNIGRRRELSQLARLDLPRSNRATRSAVGLSFVPLSLRNQTRPSLQPRAVVASRANRLVQRENFHGTLSATNVCQARSVRRQVLHALGKAGSFHSMPKFRARSLIKCK